MNTALPHGSHGSDTGADIRSDRSPRASSRAAARRTLGLARANAVLMLRNRLTLSYALVIPLLPLAFLLPAERGDQSAGAAAVGGALMLATLFPVYYNVLSLIVTRRDELVLKRLRTGETRDLELLVSIALPGVVVALLVSLVTLGVGLGFGLGLPVNLALYAASVLGGCLLYTAFAVWTAAWTANAEAAQLTSMPILVLAVVGNVKAAFPESAQRWLDLTPGAALESLVQIGWFGEGPDGEVSFTSSWAAAGEPVLVVLAWTAAAIWLARRSMRWEPRS